MFITFEGPEGSGKSTQAKKLKSFLGGKGARVVLTYEPGGTQVGKRIREMLLHPEGALDKSTEIYLFAADRAEHVTKIIQPALAEGKIVISDRYTDSTLAYQHAGRGLPEDLVRYMNMVSSHGVTPDLTLLLDVSSETGLRRAAKVGPQDRFEKEKLEFHRRVRAMYLEIAKNDPKRIRVLNTEDKAIEEVQEEIRKIVEPLL